MDSYDSNQILILLDFSRSTRFAILCTAQISKFQKNASQFWRFWIIFQNYSFKNSHFSNLRCDFFCQNFDEILSEFHEHAPNVKNFQFLEKKGSNFSKNPWKFRKCSNYSEDYSKLFSRVPTYYAERGQTLEGSLSTACSATPGVTCVCLLYTSPSPRDA